MKTDTQQKIYEVVSKISQIKVAETQLATTREELQQTDREINNLKRELDKGETRIRSLEGLSTRALFHRVLGSKETEMEKARHDFLERNMRYQDGLKLIELLQFEIAVLEGKIASRAELESELAALKAAREKEIILTDNTLRHRLLRISTKLEETFSFKQEIIEAIEVGEVCRSLATQIVGHLQKARNWGQYPNERRQYQRSSIDRARNLTYQIKHQLTLLDKEVRDIGKELTFPFEVAGITNFSNFFFGNMITDWVINQQLVNCINSAQELSRHIESVLTQLNRELADRRAIIHTLADEREQILIA